MGKWFKEGLDKAALKAAYRELAKQWHPDVNPGKASQCTETMKEINAEYDNYYSTISCYGFGDTPRSRDDIQKEAKHTRERIVMFMTRYKTSTHNSSEKGFIGYRKSWISDSGFALCIGRDNSWAGFTGGAAYCEMFDDPSDYPNKVVHRLDAVFELPTFRDTFTAIELHAYDIPLRSNCGFPSRITVHHIQTQYGEYVVRGIPSGWNGKRSLGRSWVDLIIKCNQVVHIVPTPSQLLGVCTVLGEYSVPDMLFTECTGYTLDEFIERYDVDYVPRFADAFTFRQCDSSQFSSPTIGYFLRRGIISIREATTNHTMRYGTFNFEALLKYLPTEANMADIDEVQDYLDEINDAFDKSVRRMINKGKLRIEI